MNKKIKVIIATTLFICAFSAFQPIQYSIMTTKAYAETCTYALADRGELKNLDIQSTEGKSLNICDDYDGYKENLTDEKTYYVTLDKNSDGVKIFAQSAGDDYIVKVFESDRKNATPHDIGENISLQKGTNTLYIRTFTSEDALKRAVKNESITNSDKVYKININKVSTDGVDQIYIDKLTLEGDSGNIPIKFDKDNLLYNIAVNDDEYELTIKATPEDEDYTLKIDGLKTTGDDDYKRSLPLKKGKNEIKINITDDADKTRTYTLNVNRGTCLSSTTNATTSVVTTGTSQVPKINQWVQVNNKWQYNDATGTSLKNIWFYDKNIGRNYYFQADGTMAIGWLLNSGHWYYLDVSGERQTGWLSNNGEWYYLDSEGVMKAGWIRDLTGNYYYLNSNGCMAKNTTIDGFKLGNNGGWIK